MSHAVDDLDLLLSQVSDALRYIALEDDGSMRADDRDALLRSVLALVQQAQTPLAAIDAFVDANTVPEALTPLRAAA